MTSLLKILKLITKMQNKIDKQDEDIVNNQKEINALEGKLDENKRVFKNEQEKLENKAKEIEYKIDNIDIRIPQDGKNGLDGKDRKRPEETVLMAKTGKDGRNGIDGKNGKDRY